MAIYTFYDTEGFPVIPAIDTNTALQTLWGNIPPVERRVTSAQLIGLANSNMLEITLFNLIPIMGMNFSHSISNFTPAQQAERANRANNPSKVQMIIQLMREGNNARFRFRFHRDFVKELTNNLADDFVFTLGVFNGRMSIIIKSNSANNAVMAFGVTLASGGVKIPK
ncbi:MAG: hypothetical protein MUF58_18885 [Arcicella sp.]|jgi:hypothetical protein|nr:hypothetical protein [Arcicella sp.]